MGVISIIPVASPKQTTWFTLSPSVRLQATVMQVVVPGIPAEQAVPKPSLARTKILTVVPGANPVSVALRAVPTGVQVTPPSVLYS